MKGSISKILGVLALGVSLVVAQSGWAKEDLDCGTLVEGVITEIVAKDTITVTTADGVVITVEGVPLSYLANWEILDIQSFIDNAIEVDIKAHQCPVEGTLMACDLSYDAAADPDVEEIVTIEFRQGTLGQGQKGSQGE